MGVEHGHPQKGRKEKGGMLGWRYTMQRRTKHVANKHSVWETRDTDVQTSAN